MNIAASVGGYLLAGIVLVASLGFVRWSLRTIERKDRLIDAIRVDSLNRLAHVAGKPYALSPAEEKQSIENARDQARRRMLDARIIEDPENTVDMPSPAEALQRLHDIAEDYDVHPVSEADRAPLLFDVAAGDTR